MGLLEDGHERVLKLYVNMVTMYVRACLGGRADSQNVMPTWKGMDDVGCGSVAWTGGGHTNEDV